MDREKAFILDDMEFSNISPGKKQLNINDVYKMLKNLELKVGSLEKKVVQLEKSVQKVKTKS